LYWQHENAVFPRIGQRKNPFPLAYSILGTTEQSICGVLRLISAITALSPLKYTKYSCGLPPCSDENYLRNPPLLDRSVMPFSYLFFILFCV
jgi:hypothetical protein